MAQASLSARYLESLGAALKGYWPDRARILEEVGAHLEEAAAAGVGRGLPAPAAEAEAIARFGDAKQIARAFAEQRLRRALGACASWAPLASVLLWASASLERAFPPTPLFHAEELVPEVERLVLTGWVLQAAMVPLLALAWVLYRRGQVYAASNAFSAWFCAAALGPFAVGFGRLCEGLATLGHAPTAPIHLRLGLILLALAASLPVFAAQDALAATRRAAGAGR